MISDRGTKKWTSLMLPEHVGALKRLYAEQDYKEKPILDEQQVSENDLTLHSALYNDQIVEIQYFKEHDFQTLKGKILFINVMDGCLQLDQTEIKLENIIEVNLF